MAFKMSCPKCEGLDYSVERDNRTFGAVAQAFELVFHCRCGKQLFGDALINEYERQKKHYEENVDRRTETRQVVSAERDQRAADNQDLADRLEHRRRFEADKRKAADAETERSRAEEERRWSQKTQGKSAGASAPASAHVRTDAGADGDGEECAWPGCVKIRRPNSKYCSRACSNKNARHRHKQRRKKPKKGAADEGDQAAA